MDKPPSIYTPVVGGAAYCLVHVPDLVRYGSKPQREIARSPDFEARLTTALRPYDEAVRYPPNQTYLGTLTPEMLARIDRPWFGVVDEQLCKATAPFGEILCQDQFYALLEQADVLEPSLIELSDAAEATASEALDAHPVLRNLSLTPSKPVPHQDIRADVDSGTALGLYSQGGLVGCAHRDARAEGREDDNLDARTLLEGLSAKASAATALAWLLHREGLDPKQVQFIISCGEEAAGDRYQRGGGGLAKAAGEMCGCINASGFDVKNFCAAPASALVTAAALVAAGLYERVVVVAGGSLAKLGMKSEALLAAGIPILDDCLAAHAFLITRDDGSSPLLHIEPGAVGMATIGSSTSDEAVYNHLLLQPLKVLGLEMTDIDRYAPELHNPEIMEHAGSGDVVHKSYRMIAAMAVRAGLMGKRDMAAFIDRIGMVGFAPTQGHIPSGVAYIGHAMEAMRRGEIQRAMIVSKASLFLNRLTELYDGVSFILERNRGPNASPGSNRR